MRTCIIWMGGGWGVPTSQGRPAKSHRINCRQPYHPYSSSSPSSPSYPSVNPTPLPPLLLSIISSFSPSSFKLLLLHHLHLIHLLLASLRFSADRPYLTRGVHHAALPTLPRWQRLLKSIYIPFLKNLQLCLGSVYLWH